jgi:N-acyl-D-aspartate/D-glutamate deacylase
MSEYDLVIRNGTIVDGTKLPAYKADVAVRGGKIVQINGTIKKGARKELDASGCIVAPGALDLHTHYDAQICWDPYATLSGWHGVTTVCIGQCGFGMSPCKPVDRESYMQLMTRVEAIPLDSMRRGMRWDWVSFPEYLDSLQRHGVGVNVISQVPFSPMRAYVMGVKEARERRKPTDRELAQMKVVFREGMKAGGFGFSTDLNAQDRAEDGGPIPSHVASQEEYLALAEIMSEFGVGHIEWTSGGLSASLGNEASIMEELIRLSGRPLQWGGIIHFERSPDLWKSQLGWLEDAHQRGLPLYAQSISMPIISRFTLADYNFFDDMPHWVEPFLGTAEERMAKLRNPEVRAAMKKDLAEVEGVLFHKNWRKIKIIEVAEQRNQVYEGMTIAELAERQGKEPLDAMLDLGLDERLRTEFGDLGLANDDMEAVGEIIKHPYTHLSSSDGGAHTRYLTLSTWPTHFLTYWVRDRGLMSLEEAHWKMSALPAWIVGIRDRGYLREGMGADFLVYELEKLGFLYDQPIFDTDFPGGERRIIQKAKGIRYTVVNGEVTFEDGQCTQTLPGKVLRSYDMGG